MIESMEDGINEVIDDCFSQYRHSYGYLTIDIEDDELFFFGLEILKKFGVRNPEQDGPWIKEFLDAHAKRMLTFKP